MDAVVAGIGLRGPGLVGWPDSAAVLRGVTAWSHAPIDVPPPALLSERERRRSSPSTRLALDVAQQAAGMAGLAPADLAVVFGSSLGDGGILVQLLASLATEQALVSPTHFHNSVHNAPSGYWSIGGRSHRPCTSLAAHDWTFAAVLLKAMVQLGEDPAPVLAAAFDVPFPPPLDRLRRVSEPFGVALVLGPPGRFPGRRISLDWRAGAAVPSPALPALAGLAAANPAARALPLLAALAGDAAAVLRLPCQEDGHLAIEVAPA